MQEISLAVDILPASHIIFYDPAGVAKFQLTVTEERDDGFDDILQIHTYTAALKFEMPGTIDPGDRFIVYDSEGDVIATSQLRFRSPMHFTDGDTLSLTYRQEFYNRGHSHG